LRWTPIHPNGASVPAGARRADLRRLTIRPGLILDPVYGGAIVEIRPRVG